MSKEMPYSNLTLKQKRIHLKVLEVAVVIARQNLTNWENRLEQLKKEIKL